MGWHGAIEESLPLNPLPSPLAGEGLGARGLSDCHKVAHPDAR